MNLVGELRQRASNIKLVAQAPSVELDRSIHTANNLQFDSVLGRIVGYSRRSSTHKLLEYSDSPAHEPIRLIYRLWIPVNSLRTA